MRGQGGPLEGLRIAVTRRAGQADAFVAALRGAGAEVLLAPLIRIAPPLDPLPLQRAARGLGEYDWVLLTSVNGVVAFWDAVMAVGGGAESFAGVRVACVGPVTAAAAAERGIRVDLVPDVAVAEALLEVVVAEGGVLAGARILLPVAAGARTVLERGLAALGARVERVEAYRTVADLEGAAWLRRALAEDRVDVITFASPSAVDCFIEHVGARGGRAVVAAIGPITAAAAERRGIAVALSATEFTGAGLVAALVSYAGGQRCGGSGVSP